MEGKQSKTGVASRGRWQFKQHGSAMMSFVIVAIGIWTVITALRWPFKAALFPVIIGIPFLFMALVEFLLSISEKEQRDKEENHKDFEALEEADSRGTWSILLWIFCFFAMIVLVGFPIAIPVFFILYFKLRGQNGWAIALGLAAAAWLFFYGLFIRLLHVPFPEGWVQKWL